ncbi:MAG: radical SAM family heme chaperone HemW [Chitinophagales bacterium]
MAGIYIHIPYCRQACSYCDFHFSVTQETKDSFINSLISEISIQKNYLEGEEIKTLYFGGGTPSLLSEADLEKIFNALFNHFSISSNAEITLEANPDDLTDEKISGLKHSPVNRLSIGVQSFFDKDLQWMNRAHNAAQAYACIISAQDAGFENISADLIYGLPDSGNHEWEENLNKALSFNVQHLSCYSLTVEPRTALAHLISTGKNKPLNEEQSAQQFVMLMKRMKAENWLHYEISSFALENKFISKHNTSYWFGEKYLGLGPSAHSFNGNSRQWNVANNQRYTGSLSKGILPFEKENLTPVQRINERIITELRTMWGLTISDFGLPVFNLLRTRSKELASDNLVKADENSIILTDQGKMIADKIILELMLDEEATIDNSRNKKSVV